MLDKLASASARGRRGGLRAVRPLAEKGGARLVRWGRGGAPRGHHGSNSFIATSLHTQAWKIRAGESRCEHGIGNR
jgi:hypothetical protein